MDNSNLTPTGTPATYSEEHLRHVKAAIDRIMDSIDPMLCACGSRKQYVSQRQCERCWIAGINARYQRRQEREAQANAQDDLQALTQAEQMDNDRWVQADEMNDRKHEGGTL